jgi:hypothetical protein
MMKLGSDWHVPQKAHGKKRLPVQVAKNLEKEFIDAAQRLVENKTPFAMANLIINTSVLLGAHLDSARSQPKWQSGLAGSNPSSLVLY